MSDHRPANTRLVHDMPRSVKTNFTNALLLAITDGVPPALGLGLGTQTIASIRAIAEHHPETPVAFIPEAYDAFRLEHPSVAGRPRCVKINEPPTHDVVGGYLSQFSPREAARPDGGRLRRAGLRRRQAQGSQEPTEAN